MEHRDLPVYNSIEAHGDIEVYVTQLNTGVEVHAESNLIKYVRTYVEDQTLIVKNCGFGWQRHQPEAFGTHSSLRQTRTDKGCFTVRWCDPDFQPACG